MKHEKQIGRQRQRRGFRVRNRLKRDATRPRLSVFRSQQAFLRPNYRRRAGQNPGRRQHAGQATPRATPLRRQQGRRRRGGQGDRRAGLGGRIKEVVFDRREYKYHGRVAALADAAREAGLVF